MGGALGIPGPRGWPRPLKISFHHKSFVFSIEQLATAAETCNGIPRQILCSRSGHILPQEFSSLTEHVDTFLRQGFFLNVTTTG